MRILAIRGENLASLVAPFSVDFEAPPLADAGLFAISGPTGAGKSTLLDALCLALFDTIPRLPAGHGALVGRAEEDDDLRVRSSDVRSILRRGATHGWAEVDFVGNDGRRYRARWEVRRARRKVDGRLQPQSVSLVALESGVAVGQTKTEVLAAISERLGLTFDQFRRSVLLAQGDFAAFLRASADERAALLERMTGTGLYSALSQAAYQRASAERDTLAQLRARSADVLPLDEAERHALREQAEAAQQALQALAREYERVSAGLHWHERYALACAEEAEARTALESAEATHAAGAPRRAQLDRLRSAQPLRAVLEGRRSAAGVLAEREQALARVRREQETAREALADSETAMAEARARATAAETEGETLRGPLAEARALDTRLGLASAHAGAAERDRDAARQALEAAVERLRPHQQGFEAARADREAASGWLDGHLAYRELATQWARWSSELDRLETALDRRREDRAELDRIGGERDRLRAREAETAAAVEAANAALADAEDLFKACAADVAGVSIAGLRAERQALEVREAEWRRANERVQEARRLAALLERSQRMRTKAGEAASEARRRLAEADEQLPLLKARREEAERALVLAAAARDAQVEHLRSLLVEGQACPVCGAQEHPYAGRPEPLDDQLLDQRERVDELGRRLEACREARAGARGALERHEAEAEAMVRDQAQWESEMAAVREAWAAECRGGFEGKTLESDAVASLLRDRRQQLSEERGDLEARERAAEERLAERARAEAAREAARAEVERVRAEQASLSAQSTELGLRGEALRRTLADRDHAVEVSRGALSAPLAPLGAWFEALLQDARGFRERVATWPRLWAEQTERSARSEAAMREHEQSCAEARHVVDSAQERLAEAERCWRGAVEGLAALREARAGWLDGGDADAVEQAARAAVDRARAAHEAAQQICHERRTALAGLVEREAALSAQWARDRAAADAASVRLEAALARSGLTPEALESLLEVPAEWLEEEGRALAGLAETRQRARTVLEERARARQALEDSRPADGRAQLEEAASGIDEKRDEITNRLALHRAALQNDDERRRQSAALAVEVAAQEARTGVWDAMTELIGSADGRKFRAFAQSLTLETLLAHANRHLAALAPRYRLERVPGADLELQVIDGDMGDEVRGVHSLSGGESFLVSLALALGLASLSSDRVSVESLFIDEGFGSLDPDALDLAVASLDALQALGRQVGVISHVPTLVERIGVRVQLTPTGGGRSMVEVRES